MIWSGEERHFGRNQIDLGATRYGSPGGISWGFFNCKGKMEGGIGILIEGYRMPV